MLPVLALLACEGVLRLCGYGGYPALFREAGKVAGGGTLWVTDNGAARSYFFASPERPGTFDDAAVVMPKPPGTVRVLMMGESAMKGFPQPRALASSEFVRVMLSDVWKDRRVEVVNLGCTAVASFPVLGMLGEALRVSPDLVVLYVGNNEFFGAYGVASLNRAGASPTAMRMQRWARSTAVVQAVGWLLRSRGGGSHEGKTLMESMMGRSFTGPGDPMRVRAVENLRVFVAEMVEQCRKAEGGRGVPVIVCTLPCNLGGLAPLGDSDAVIADPGERLRVRAALDAASERCGTDAASAESAAREIVTAHPAHARARFILGTALEKLGRMDEARVEFQAAADLDPMPWRPTSGSDAALRSAATGGAVLCDLKGAFQAEASREGAAAPGWTLLDDHVHPTLFGQFVVAREIVRSMERLGGALKVSSRATEALSGFEHDARVLGANEFERYGVAHQMRVLGKIPFFAETNPGMYPRFDAVCRGLEAGWDDRLRQVALEWQKPETHKGAKRPLSGMAGKVLVTQGRAEEAAGVFDLAVRCVFPYSSWSLEYELYRLGCVTRGGAAMSEADAARARSAIERGMLLLRHPGPESGATERHVGMLHQVLGEDEKSIPFLHSARTKLYEEAKVACDNALVGALVRTGRAEDARRIAQDGARNAGAFAPVYRKLLEAIEARSGGAGSGGSGNKP